MTKRARLNLAILTVFGTVGILIYIGIQNATVPFYTVDELVHASELEGSVVTVEGELVVDSVVWDDERLLLTFDIRGENGDTVSVRYGNVPPDVFGEHVEAIVEGPFVNGEIEAERVLVRCPSKYKAEDEEFVDLEDWDPLEHQPSDGEARTADRG